MEYLTISAHSPWDRHYSLQAREFLESPFVYTVPKILFRYSQNWNCVSSFPMSTFIYLWAIYIFPGSVCLPGCTKIGRPISCSHRSRIHECGNWKIEHYNSVLEITRPVQFYFWECINRNQTFTYIEFPPAICNVQPVYQKVWLLFAVNKKRWNDRDQTFRDDLFNAWPWATRRRTWWRDGWRSTHPRLTSPPPSPSSPPRSEWPLNNRETVIKVIEEYKSKLGTASSPQCPTRSEWPLNNRETDHRLSHRKK